METVGLDYAISCFLAGMERETRRIYRHWIQEWLAWCRENALDPSAVGREHIEGYIRWMRDVRGISKASVRSRVSPVCCLYRYAREEGIIAVDPGEHVRYPRVYGHSTGTYLTREEAARFLGCALAKGDDALALCRVLLLCGLRISEALGIDVEDYDAGRKTVTIRKRKGDWSQTVSVSSAVAASFDALAARRSTGPMIRAGGKRMPAKRARGIVASVAEGAGLEGVTPHSLRRTFATLSRDAGVPDRDIIASGGWGSQRMLDYYDMARRGATSTAPEELEKYLNL
ncbi:tyrosine-type recombinase/integrase [Collinsella ihumii]|uniref:tyrosine-type recombinase/integrase n=1 Tax=Collinsella ihumii TaxID=1720204 RepID=UPI0025AB4521|nr:tyrosine-type recombinase/integrase [Collinsella ihumii]MDN0055554.1 tyrosine-type recombinase/integrase [Collinsella ihumii]